MKGLNGALMSFYVPVCFGVGGEYDLVVKQFG